MVLAIAFFLGLLSFQEPILDPVRGHFDKVAHGRCRYVVDK